MPAARLARCRPLLAALRGLDGGAALDINEERSFFSYEHFYVIYCKFWELDDDHNFELDLPDLLRYANYALSRRAAARVYDLRREPTRHASL